MPARGISLADPREHPSDIARIAAEPARGVKEQIVEFPDQFIRAFRRLPLNDRDEQSCSHQQGEAGD
jgi:hypothetical protein